MDNVFAQQLFMELPDLDEEQKEVIRSIVTDAQEIWYDNGRSDGYDEGWDAGYVQGRYDGYDEAMIEMGQDDND